MSVDNRKKKEIIKKAKRGNLFHIFTFIIVLLAVGSLLLSPYLYYVFFKPAEYDIQLYEPLYSRTSIKIGAAIDLNQLKNNEKYHNVAIEHFNSYTAENIMKMSYLYPENDSYFFEDADYLVEFAENHSIIIHGHCLIWHQQTPSWLPEFNGTRSEWMNMLENYIKTVVGRYKGRIESWDVVNEAVENNRYRNTTWFDKIGPEYIEYAFKWAHEADPEAKLYYNDYNICYDNLKLKFTIEMINNLTDKGVPIHGIGFQAHIDSKNPTISSIERAMAKVNELGIDVRISELDISMNNFKLFHAYTEPLMNFQKERYFSVVKAFSKAERLTGITLWGIDDGNSWIPNFRKRMDWPLLFDKELEPKPAILGFKNAIEEI